MKITQYSSYKANEIVNVFHQAVHAIDSSLYGEEQKKSWAPLPIDYKKWQKRFDEKKPYLLLINGAIAGFIELEPDGHINCLYVLPKFQRKGVASALLKYVIAIGIKGDINQLYVEASIVAKPFFEKYGFFVENENKVIRNNKVLINYSMCMNM